METESKTYLKADKVTLHTGEDLGDLEGLRHETLDLTGTLKVGVSRC